MTITCKPMDADPATGLPEYSAKQERQTDSPLFGGGSGRRLGGRSGFRIDTPSNVLTATSTTWTLVPCSAMIDPGASTHQGMYGWATDANVTGAVTAADETYARKDIVFIQINDDSAGDGSGLLTGNVRYVAGVPSATPEAPQLGILDRTRSFEVGTIHVPQLGGGSPTVTLNPARFVAAGAVQPISSQEEQDALTPYDGMQIRRNDLPGRPVRLWSSTAAKWGPGAEAQGMTLRKKVTANGIGLTNLSVVENLATYDFRAGRKYRIVWQGGYSMSATGNYFDLAIHTASPTDAAGLTTGLTQLMSRTYTANGAGFGESFYVEAIYEPTADTTRQVKFTINRTVGAGTWTLQAGATAPAYYYIEDLGAQF